MKYLVILLCMATMAMADAPLVWNHDGIPIRQGDHIEWQKSTCPGENGEVIVAWSDTREQLRDLFIQKIDSDGDQVWGNAGFLVNGGPSRQEDPVLESDANGGAFIFWVDFRTDSAGDVRAQHIDTDGNLLMGDEGLVMCDESNVQISLNTCSDGNGGSFVLWSDSRTGDTDIYMTRIQADGTVAAGFAEDGTPVCVEGGEQGSTSFVPDGNGGAWLVWADKRIPNDHNIYIQHIQSDGTMLLADNGAPLCAEGSQQLVPKLASDGNGGVFASWIDKRDDNVGDIYVQHLDSDGNPSFTENGVPISATPNSEEKNNRIVSAGAGFAIVMWEDNRNDPSNTVGDIYAQKISDSDESVWTEGGVEVCLAEEEQIEARMSGDGTGGAFISWTDRRAGGTFGSEDIYVQHLSSDGEAEWGIDGDSNGKPACLHSGGQIAPSTRLDQNGGVFAIWGDLRYGSIGIFANCLDADGDTRFSVEDGVEVVWGIDGNAYNLVSTPTDDGGVIYAWEDNRFSGSVIVAQKVNDADDNDAMAEIAWTPNGSVLHQDFSDREQRTPQIIQDGNGAYVGFTWGPDLGTAAFVTRLGDDGNTLWDDPASVTAVYNEHPTDYQQDLKICSDGSGGVIAAWSDHNEDIHAFYPKVFVQRFDASGNRLWGDAGIQVSFDDFSENFVLDMVSDGDGGAYILWRFGIWSMFDLAMQHINGDGGVVAGWDDEGETVCGASGDQLRGGLAQYHVGGDVAGVYAFWNDPRTSENAKDIYGQRVLADATMDWVEDGIPLVALLADQEYSQGSSDGEGGLYLMWKDFSSGSDFNIYMQHYDSAGETQWSAEDSEICMASNDQQSAIFTTFEDDGETGIISVWSDLRGNNHYDLYGQQMDEDGAHVWVDNNLGAQVNAFFHHQKYPTMSYDGEGGAFLGWVDMRSSGKEDLQNIYAQRVNVDYADVKVGPVTPSSFALLSSYPNPFNPTTTVSLALMAPVKEAELKVYNVRGQHVATLHDGALEIGVHDFSWDAASFASGLYLVRYASNRETVSHKMLLIK